jgi:hypothetical protein
MIGGASDAGHLGAFRSADGTSQYRRELARWRPWTVASIVPSTKAFDGRMKTLSILVKSQVAKI